jgi:hypothetical protein
MDEDESEGIAHIAFYKGKGHLFTARIFAFPPTVIPERCSYGK